MILNIKQTPDGKAMVHYLISSENGPIETPLRTEMTGMGRMNFGGFKGYKACDPLQNTILPQNRGGQTFLCIAVTEPRAVTCPACKETPDYRNQMAMIGQLGKG